MAKGDGGGAEALDGDFGGEPSRGGLKGEGPSGSKRKRDAGGGEGGEGHHGGSKTKKGKKERAATGADEERARIGSAEGCASYLWETVTQQCGPGLHRGPPEAARFLVPSDGGGSRRGAGIAEGVSALGPVWRKALLGKDPSPGRPRVLVVCGSALRAVDVCKQLGPTFAPKHKDLHVARLFAKHKKVDDQIHFLANFKCALAVGTPNRVLKLLETRLTGANGPVAPLDLSDLALIIFDLALDAKGFHVLSLKDTRQDVSRLYLDHVHPMLTAADAKEGQGPKLWLRPEAPRHIKL